MIASHQRRSPWTRTVLFLAGTAAAYAIHSFTLARVAAWQPGYPGHLVIGTFTPPPLMRDLHVFGPAVLAIAFTAFALASWRGLPVIARSAWGVLIVSLVLYAWALFWVIRVSRYIFP